MEDDLKLNNKLVTNAATHRTVDSQLAAGVDPPFRWPIT